MNIKEDLLLYYHRYTLQLIHSSLQEVRVVHLSGGNGSSNSGSGGGGNNGSSGGGGGSSSNTSGGMGTNSIYMGNNSANGGGGSDHGSPCPSSVLQCVILGDQTYEFIICRPAPGNHHHHHHHHPPPPSLGSSLPSPFDHTSGLFYKGLSTATVEPSIWAHRVADYLNYEIRLDLTWLRWAKYMRRTALNHLISNPQDRQWFKRAKGSPALDNEYKRLYVQDMNWRFNDLNASYHLCPTYPSVLVFPGQLDEDDLIGGASQRSIGRLPALVWLHPDTKAPLCRAAQPLAGLSGSSIEYDKKMCLAIKASSPNGLPLRITDARPKLNANANAVQGKGFENISFLGGPSVASLVFLDIDNIHVMRHSIRKLKDGFGLINQPIATFDTISSNGSSSSGGGGGGGGGGGSNGMNYDGEGVLYYEVQ
eukprot:scaffold1105_cov184-Ochromonas_danica.AAC.6